MVPPMWQQTYQNRHSAVNDNEAPRSKLQGIQAKANEARPQGMVTDLVDFV